MILAQILGIPKIQFTDHINIKMKEDQSVDTTILLRKGKKETQRQSVEQTERKTSHKLPHPRDPIHIQSLNTDIYVGAKKCLLTGT